MTPSRRTVLQGGLASACAAMTTLPHWSLASPTSPTNEVSLLVVDDGFAEGRAFAEETARWNRNVHTISGDVTSLWYRDLHRRWQSATSVIAGLTGYTALFCLERLAWDANHRVVIRIDHTRRALGEIEHVVKASASVLSQTDRLPANWGPAMARLLLTSRIDSRAPRASRTVRSSSVFSAAWAEPLVSWVIAPKGWAGA